MKNRLYANLLLDFARQTRLSEGVNMLFQAERLLSRYCKRNTRIHVVCIGQRHDGLMRLLHAGASIQYLVVPSSLSVILPVHQNLECRELNGGDPGLKTFHFIFAESPEMLWLERNHLPNLPIAYGCEWVPPTLAVCDPRIGKLRDTFAEAWQVATLR